MPRNRPAHPSAIFNAADAVLIFTLGLCSGAVLAIGLVSLILRL